MMRRVFLMLLFSTVIVFGFAQEIMDLPKAISIALENNYGIKIADHNIAIAEKNNTWAQAGKTPTIDLNGTFNNNLINDNNPASFLQGTYYTGSLAGSIDANWVIYGGGRFEVAKDQLEFLVREESLNKDLAIHDLLQRIYQEYFNVLFQQERLKVLRETYALSEAKLAYELVKKEYGSSNSLNIIQFENALVTDSINIVSQTLQVETAKSNLYTTLVLPPFSNFAFNEQISVTDETISRDKLQKALTDENYTLKNLALLSELNALNTQLAKAQRRPILSVGGSLGLSQNGFKFFEDNPTTGEPFEFLFSNRINGSLSANFTWNIYDGGVQKTAVQTAKLQEEITKLSIEEANAQLSNQLDVLIINYENQREVLNLSDEQIRLAKENLEMLDERFKSGLATSIDYRSIQLQYLNAAFAKVSAMYNLILTKSEIDYLAGKFKQDY